MQPYVSPHLSFSVFLFSVLTTAKTVKPHLGLITEQTFFPLSTFVDVHISEESVFNFGQQISLQQNVQDLKDENQGLKEVEGKALWRYRDEGDTGRRRDTKDTDKFVVSGGYHRNADRVMMHEEIWEVEARDLIKEGLKSKSCGPHIVSKELNTSNILSRRRELALSRSLFSAILSLVAGMIVGEAEDPCMPLVAALFTVVVMSLMSVVQFFMTIDDKPASDAVALLSFNWFILGTLAYPTLPRVAHVLAPLASSVVKWILI